MRLANLHHSNIGGLLLEAFYSHQHSWWFIVAKAPIKAAAVTLSQQQLFSLFRMKWQLSKEIVIRLTANVF